MFCILCRVEQVHPQEKGQGVYVAAVRGPVSLRHSEVTWGEINSIGKLAGRHFPALYLCHVGNLKEQHCANRTGRGYLSVWLKLQTSPGLCMCLRAFRGSACECVFAFYITFYV